MIYKLAMKLISKSHPKPATHSSLYPLGAAKLRPTILMSLAILYLLQLP